MAIGKGKARRQARRAGRKERRDARRNKGDESSAGGGPHSNDTAGLLKYPLDILSEDITELMRFSIKSRDDLKTDKQTIYLYTPPGIVLADSASYSASEFGFTGALQQNASNIAPLLKGETAGVSSMKDTLMANKAEVASAAIIAAKQKLNWGVLDKGLVTAGRAKNANTNLQFDGIGMRSFTFAFKLVAESSDEAIEIRKIENTFRKFLYPSNESSLGMVLKYPPYWSIQFMSHRDGKVDENRYLPYIDLCYLRNVSATYNSSTNAYHKGGQPVELDLSLSFDEAQQNVRENIYSDPGEFSSANYHYERTGLQSSGLDSTEAATGGDT